MPRQKAAGPRRKLGSDGEVASLDDLSGDQVMELCIGPVGSTISAFESEAERKREYFRHASILRSHVNPGTRPWGWWVFESPDAGSPIWPNTNESRLRELGELTEAELLLLDGESTT